MRSTFLLISAILLMTALPARSDEILTFHASPEAQGGDGSAGKPFAGLAAARDAVRKRLADGERRDIRVLLAGGYYPIAETVVFGPADSAADGQTITYEAREGHQPTLGGGAVIDKWRKLEDAPESLPDAARGKVYVADLPEGLGTFSALFDRDGLLPRARGAGFTPTKRYPRGSYAHGQLHTTLHFPEGALRDWDNLADVEIAIIPTWPWKMALLPLKSVDEQQQVAETAVGAIYPLGKPNFGSFPNGSAWVENVLDVLDAPGEWVLNTAERKLYLWPRSKDGTPGRIVAPQLTELVRVEGKIDYDGPTDTPVRGLRFRGLRFTHADRCRRKPGRAGWGLQHDWEIFDRPTAMLRFRGAERCAVEECAFRDSGSAGLRADLHARNLRVARNLFANLGGVGILFAGYGPGTKDVNRDNEIVDNQVHHIGRLVWHSPGIFLWQSGHNTVAHNLLYSTPYTGIAATGRISFNPEGRGDAAKTVRWEEVNPVRKTDGKRFHARTYEGWTMREPFLHARKNRIEQNEIHHAMEVLGDGNAIYISGAGAGNVVRGNYIHHVLGVNVNAQIRCDDDQHETIIDRNVIWRCCGEGIIIKGRNDVTNNIIADLRATSPDGRPASHQRGYLVLPHYSVKGAKIQRNIFYSTTKGQKIVHEHRKGEPPDRSDFTEADADANVYWNTKDPDWGKDLLRRMRKAGKSKSSVVADPGFFDVPAGVFQVPDDSPAVTRGFEPISIQKVGPRREAEQP